MNVYSNIIMNHGIMNAPTIEIANKNENSNESKSPTITYTTNVFEYPFLKFSFLNASLNLNFFEYSIMDAICTNEIIIKIVTPVAIAKIFFIERPKNKTSNPGN